MNETMLRKDLDRVLAVLAACKDAGAPILNVIASANLIVEFTLVTHVWIVDRMVRPKNDEMRQRGARGRTVH